MKLFKIIGLILVLSTLGQAFGASAASGGGGGGGSSKEQAICYSIMSWNLGTDRDYLRFKCREDLSKIKSRDDEIKVLDSVKQKRDAMFSDLFSSLSYDFYTFQEVEQRDRLESWFPGNYGFIYDNVDTAIVYNKERFLLLEETTENESALFSIAIFKELSSCQKLQIFSAHLTGCHKHSPEPMEADIGNRQLVQMLKRMDTSVDFSVIGADFNTSPAYQKRIGIPLEKGFLADTDMTAGTVFDGAKIDYVMFRNGRLSIEHIETEISSLQPSDIENPSDHRYIIKHLTVKPASSTIKVDTKNRCLIM
jgi:hypothetical protein|tara:strand:+ start:728 stop:1651 length:924 start_codon:yes stop_codon:yes gene_type:complete